MNSHIFVKQLACQKDELRDVLMKVQQRIAEYRGQKGYPPRIAKLYWYALRGESIPADVDKADWVGGAALRGVDNFYGWMAKDTLEKLGLCSGALYRSARFLELSLSERCGRRGLKQTVHIEHTVPIHVLFKALKINISRFATPTALHDFRIQHSVCTALHFAEKAAIISNQSPAFDGSGMRIGDHPFMRYAEIAERDENFRIFNVITGKEIELAKFTFADHIDTLLEASRLVMRDASGIGIYSLHLFE